MCNLQGEGTMTQSSTLFVQNTVTQPAEKATVLAVTSGKGGVGKTNIAANIAVCLAASNKRVVLLDADLGLGNLDVIMNINSRHNLLHVVKGQRTLNEITCVGPAGVEVICGGSGLEDMANLSQFQRQRLVDELDTLQQDKDVIVVDTGAGINSSIVGFCLASNHTLVVTTPEPTAMTDAYAMIKVMAKHHYQGKVSLLVNMADSLEEGKRIFRQIADVANRFLNMPIYEAGVICRDDTIRDAVKMRKPVVLAFPNAKITESFAAISARLSRGTVFKPTQRGGFFKNIFNWFF